MRHTDSGGQAGRRGGVAGGGNQSGGTRRLAIFRVHSVAKPQLTALLGSYSSSRPLASFLLYLLLFFRSLFSSRSSSLPILLHRDTVCFFSRPVAIYTSLLVRFAVSLRALFFFIASHMPSLSLFFSTSLFARLLSRFFFLPLQDVQPPSLLVSSRLRLLQWVSVNKRVSLR